MIKNAMVVSAIFFAGCSSRVYDSFNSANDILSFQYGYAVQKQFESTRTPQNMEQFIAGMEAAKRGEPFPFSDDELRDVFIQFEGIQLEDQKANNLAQAEDYLKTISLDPSFIELVPQKLYYKKLNEGNGQSIGPEDILLANYTASVLELNKEIPVFSPDTSPISISVGDTISGFAQGVEGMQIGERRKLFIHPELAYGTFGGKIDPNQLLIIDVEVVGVIR